MTGAAAPAVGFVALRDDDHDALVEWLCSDTWPFHSRARPDPTLVRGWIAESMFSSAESRTFWIVGAEDGGDARVGLLRLFDLDDPTPLFDLRIRTEHRGRGLGRAAVRWLTAHLFADEAAYIRVEATTRVDNRAMRRVLRACGYVKEAHFRQAWPDADGKLLDAIGYGILRHDWERGATTPVDWDDEDR